MRSGRSSRDVSETDAVERARRGDRAAFAALVAGRLEDGHRVASALIGARAAEAAVEDAFVAAWRELPRLAPDAEFGPWLESILVGACVMRARGAASDPGGTGATSPAPLPLARAEGSRPERARQLFDEAFERLDPADRAVLVLDEVAGRSPAEIARVVHEPVGAVRARNVEARTSLADALETVPAGEGHADHVLIGEMLELRASAPPPDLGPRIAMRIAGTRQARVPRRWSRFRDPILVVLTMALVAASGVVVGRLWQTAGSGTTPPIASLAAQPSGVPSPTEEPAASDESPSSAILPVTPTALTMDQMAIVTADGYNLRVRSAPGVTDATTRLQPLLPSGTRMLVLRGPIAVDGYAWYQVEIDRAPWFGWVASGGDGVDWLAPVAARCSGARQPSELWTRPALDLLACYGEEPFAVQVVGTAGQQPGPCASAPNRQGCKAEPSWLLEPMTLSVLADTPDGTASISVAVPESVRDAIAAASKARPLTILVALDRPSAQSCHVVDAAGLDVIARDAAVATCRLTFAVVAMAQ